MQKCPELLNFFGIIIQTIRLIDNSIIHLNSVLSVHSIPIAYTCRTCLLNFDQKYSERPGNCAESNEVGQSTRGNFYP